MCAAYCMRACVWLMPSIRTLFRFTLEWKLPMFVRVCSNTVSRTGTENHEPTRTMVKKKIHTHTHTRAHTHTHLCWVILQGLWWRLQGELLLAVPTFQPLCLIVKKERKKLLFSILCFFFPHSFLYSPCFSPAPFPPDEKIDARGEHRTAAPQY